MNVTNFLARLRGLKVGDTTNTGGFLKDISVSPQSIATTGTRATAENAVPADAIVIDADGEDAIVNFTVPRDYDEGLDHLKVILQVSYVSGTSIAIGASAVSLGRVGSAFAAKSGFSAPTATTVASGSDCVEIEADLSSLTHLRHDNLAVNFAASNATSVPVAHILGARIEYRSSLVSYDEESGTTQLR